MKGNGRFPSQTLKQPHQNFPLGLRALSEVLTRTRAFFHSVSWEIALQEMRVVSVLEVQFLEGLAWGFLGRFAWFEDGLIGNGRS